MHNETVIWQIGKGYNRQQLAGIEISREAKVSLHCLICKLFKKKLLPTMLSKIHVIFFVEKETPNAMSLRWKSELCSIKILSSQFKIQSLLSGKTFLGLVS